MEPVTMDCPSCKSKLRIPLDSPADAQIFCPKCGSKFSRALPEAENRPLMGALGTTAPLPYPDTTATENPFASPRAPSNMPATDFDAAVQAAAKKLVKEKQDKDTSIQLLVTGILGCFSPILAIYGLVFLLRRPEPFPGKGLALAGTILHGMWCLFLIVIIVLANHQ